MDCGNGVAFLFTFGFSPNPVRIFFTRKLLGYALGRPLQPGDTALLETLQTGLPKNDFHFRFLVETIVTSSQFLSRRR